MDQQTLMAVLPNLWEGSEAKSRSRTLTLLLVSPHWRSSLVSNANLGTLTALLHGPAYSAWCRPRRDSTTCRASSTAFPISSLKYLARSADDMPARLLVSPASHLEFRWRSKRKL